MALHVGTSLHGLAWIHAQIIGLKSYTWYIMCV